MRIVAATNSEAERIIADVWLALERIKLPSPRITVSSQSPSLLIDLHFKQPNHEEVVRNEALSGYGRAILASAPGRIDAQGLCWIGHRRLRVVLEEHLW